MNAGLAKASKHNFPKPATLFAEGSQVELAFLHDSAELAQNLFVHSSIEDREGMCMCPAGPWHDKRRSEECCFRTGDRTSRTVTPFAPSSFWEIRFRRCHPLYWHRSKEWFPIAIHKINRLECINISEFSNESCIDKGSTKALNSSLQSNSLLIQKIGVGPWVFSSRALEFLSFKQHQPMQWVRRFLCRTMPQSNYHSCEKSDYVCRNRNNHPTILELLQFCRWTRTKLCITSAHALKVGLSIK